VLATAAFEQRTRWINLDRTHRDSTSRHGDLIVMGGRAQRDWRHSVPKQATPAGPRISIDFAPSRR
jgi:alkylated DNA repair dioxygenase AlkB